MPVYEYQCNGCFKRFEVSQSMRDAPLQSCPECGEPVKRILTGGNGFLVKGGAAEMRGRPQCGRSQTCCGSSVPCEEPSCGGV
ncbi:MAG TPA: zinc ribbon domain-containing protein [Nitrospirota bacterium]|nr:zinc ribbon domain-containing protein [Nitrospirota bacterium]